MITTLGLVGLVMLILYKRKTVWAFLLRVARWIQREELLMSIWDGAKKGFILIALSTSVILLIIGYVNYESSLPFHKFSKEIGKALLITGVFAVILKSFQFGGVYEDAVRRIVHGTEYLKSKSSITPVLTNIIVSVQKDDKSRLAPALAEVIESQYLKVDPKDHFYHENHKHIFVIPPKTKGI